MAPRRFVAQRGGDRVHEAAALAAMTVRDRLDDAALAVQQLGDLLVDRPGREQVPRGDRVVLADAVAAVLGLVVRAPASTPARGTRRSTRASA